jgi:hypothetical protein
LGHHEHDEKDEQDRADGPGELARAGGSEPVAWADELRLGGLGGCADFLCFNGHFIFP